jgi:hypothetical protein
MVSFDVDRFFTSIPGEDVLEIINNKIDEDGNLNEC